jgi:signal transduction histidine kinase
MRAGSTRYLAWALFALVLLEIVGGATFDILARTKGAPATFHLGDLGYVAAFLLFPIVGLALATRRPENALGWLMLVIGVVAFQFPSGYGDYAIVAGLPGASWALASTTWTWVPVIGLAGIFVPLLFPDGHLPSPGWRWFARVVAAGMVVASLAILLSPGNLADFGYPRIRNPFGIEAIRSLVPVGIASIAMIPLGVVGAAVSLVVRFRRSGPTERLQIRWLASTLVVVAVSYVIAMLVTAAASAGWTSGGGWIAALQNYAILLFALIPISIGIAVLRYHLYDIDVVVRKTVIVAAIAIFFTAVYVSVVGGIGALIEAHSTTVLSFLAAALVAALFQPVLRWSRRLADRIVYGKRATPYEVLSDFSERVAGTYAAEDVLPRMARVVAEGVGAASAYVWLKRDERWRVAASWPPDIKTAEEVSTTGPGLPELPGADAAFAVEHQGELLGALAVAMPAADPIDEAKAKLVSDLAAQAGLVLRNVGLTDELRSRLQDLEAAQKRLVAAQNEERRRIERNLHDGAQQQLVALAVKQRLATSLVRRDPDAAARLLEELQAESTEALENLRDLAHGIYPPILADRGLVEALESQARRATVPVSVEADSIGRYEQEIEAAAYFCCLEALQNVAKYAAASKATIALAGDDGWLRFAVTDDGAGFDPEETPLGSGLQGMEDRLAALGGDLGIHSEPGAGTTVTGRIPVATENAVATLRSDGRSEP